MANNKFGAKEVMDVTLYQADGSPFIHFDTLKTSSIAVTSEKVYARGGKGNPKLITWEINKEATLTIEDALLSPKSLELVSGMASKTGAKTISHREEVTCATAKKLVLSNAVKAIADVHVYPADDDCGTAVASVTIDSTDSTGKTLSGDSIAKDKNYIVYYTADTAATADTYVITADKFAGTYKLVGDTVVRNVDTGEDEAFQIVIPNLKWTSDLQLGFAAEGDPATTTFECEILRPSNSTTMIEMIKY